MARLGPPEWQRCLPSQDGDYQSGPYSYMAKMGTTRVAQMAIWTWWGTSRVAKTATWPRWGLPELPRWLHGQDGDYKSGLDNYMAKVGTTRVAKMTTWPIFGLPEWPR